MPRYVPGRRELGSRLRLLRESAPGVPGQPEFAARLGARWSQSKVSRIELGEQAISEGDLNAWLDASGAPGEVRAELTDLRDRAASEYEDFSRKHRRRRGGVTIQEEYARYEQAAAAIRIYSPMIVPGLLQMAPYALAMLRSPGGPVAFGATDDDVRAMVAARIKRQGIIYERQVGAVMLQAGLRTRVAPPLVLRDQLDRLTVLAGLGTVALGIIPDDIPVPVPPVSIFTLFDDDLVISETLSGELMTDDPDRVAQHVKWYAALEEAAVFAGDAVTLIRGEMRALAGQGPAPPDAPPP